ncbi:Voltage-dependent anion channel [Acididesulfobacillus acetoxydans]|uniref:C4-dicarboxylate transporter/malic acid transport protein n=1 Tax=Acididesulfobacillus acetoxydans TaxID=1561005 RepID=A0A8S0X5D0_9FIRM|nr:C4-dicarboxylate ABC transporter [Acididesulfobacillus acetoxydans]CAA7601530.1 Voltage-dependent anion channel [Acididesulfobacillus acetoxydans]CEJ07017.1 C4-dicarboxylate transporter/malic acid transport protein [Acididesulfobacillus acetoxydans]
MPKQGLARHFSPAWFAAIMGTGGFANILYSWGNLWPASKYLGISLAWLNALLCVIFLIPWLTRWFAHFDQLRHDLDHPVMGNFFVTMPIGIVIVATNAALMGRNFLGPQFVLIAAWIAWLTGVVGAFLLSVYVAHHALTNEQTPPQALNFAWLITPVANIGVPLIGNPLVGMLKQSGSAAANTVLLFNLAFYGVGFFLFLFIGAMVLSRLVRHPLPPAAMAPTFWITLGPIGVGTVSLLGLADMAKLLGFLGSVDAVYLLAAIFWGFGFWGLGIALTLSWYYLKRGGIPFSLSWWAFIFPLVAYTMASQKIASYFSSSLILVYTVFLTLLLTFLWLVTFIRSLGGAMSGKLLEPQPQAPQQS